ncbi:retrovirus-related pol polyprotein from transposon TNT 1-94 [Tanacetum coccineum]
MTGNHSQLMNFISKFLGTFRFRNDNIAKIMGYGDYQLRNVTISRVYYVEGLVHNLFSVGQFYDADLEVLAKDGLARGILRFKFQKDHMCSACALGKSKKFSHQPKAEDTNQEKLYLLHMDLCSPMRDKKPNLSFFHVFGALCYPTNDNDNLGKLDAKADIGIFVGYVPAKKAFIIYNKRTQKIIETIHVTFDELTAMASEQFSLGSGLQYDWDHLFQPMFDEYFNPSSIAVTPVQDAVAPRAVVLADSPVSTSIDQDAPSTSIPSTQEQEQSPNISQGFEESPKHQSFVLIHLMNLLIKNQLLKDHHRMC